MCQNEGQVSICPTGRSPSETEKGQRFGAGPDITPVTASLKQVRQMSSELQTCCKPIFAKKTIQYPKISHGSGNCQTQETQHRTASPLDPSTQLLNQDDRCRCMCLENAIPAKVRNRHTATPFACKLHHVSCQLHLVTLSCSRKGR